MTEFKGSVEYPIELMGGRTANMYGKDIHNVTPQKLKASEVYLNPERLWYVYSIYSKAGDRYYIGISSDPWKRLKNHNRTSSLGTCDQTDWKFHHFYKVEDAMTALKVEAYCHENKIYDITRAVKENKQAIPTSNTYQILETLQEGGTIWCIGMAN